jgi:hypothetical protein
LLHDAGKALQKGHWDLDWWEKSRNNKGLAAEFPEIQIFLAGEI